MHKTVVEACRVAAEKYDVPVSTLMAVVETESDGVAYANVNGKSEPLIRWEGHYFDKRLDAGERTIARKLGLASPKAGVVKNPSKQQARWDRLYIPGTEIDEEAATESISMGVGQVMGSHDQKLGFDTAVKMFDYVRQGAVEQVDLMMRYVKEFDLLDELERGDFTGFARGYNGPNYKKYAYHTKMRAAAKKYAYMDDAQVKDGVSVKKPERAEKAESMLRMGTEGAKVRELQALLVRAGHAVKVDGDFGDATRRAVKAFQKKHKLEVDGIVGPKTWKLLETYKADPAEQPGVPGPAEAVVETPEGKQGGVTAVAGTALTAAIEPAKDALMPLTGTGGIVDTVYTVLTIAGVLVIVIGVVWAGVGWYRANTTRGVKAA